MVRTGFTHKHHVHFQRPLAVIMRNTTNSREINRLIFVKAFWGLI
jgi:hypothetical protein